MDLLYVHVYIVLLQNENTNEFFKKSFSHKFPKLKNKTLAWITVQETHIMCSLDVLNNLCLSIMSGKCSDWALGKSAFHTSWLHV